MHPLEKILLAMLVVQMLHLGITMYMATRRYYAVTPRYHIMVLWPLMVVIAWLVVRVIFHFHELFGII